MTIVINDVSPRVHYTATAGQTVFVVPFAWFFNSELKVWVNGILVYFSAPPTEQWMYSTTGEGNSAGGSITFGPPGRMAGDKVVIIRDIVIDRTTDFPTSGIFPVEALNATFDEMTAMIQQTEVNVQNRSLTLTDHDEPPVLNDLPLKAVRANKLLSFDANGQPQTNIDLQTFLDAINAARDAALDDIADALADALAQMQDLVDQAEAAADLAEQWAIAAQLIIIQDEPPVPLPTQRLWWDSNSGHLFVCFNDGDSTQWVQISGPAGAGVPGDPGPAGAPGAPGTPGINAVSYLRWACGDETTPITAANSKITDRIPYAFTATGIRASLNTAQASGSTFTVDFKYGAGFATALSTLITFDNGETTSVTAAIQPVLSQLSFASDEIIRIDVTQVGDGTATGLKVTLLGHAT